MYMFMYIYIYIYTYMYVSVHRNNIYIYIYMHTLYVYMMLCIHIYIASTSSSTRIFDRAFEKPKPAPEARRYLELFHWSPKIGVITAGIPARSAACVVPMPPWWTMHLHLGSSHACGASATKSTLCLAKSRSSRASATAASKRPSRSCCPSSCSRAHPPISTPRERLRLSARRA